LAAYPLVLDWDSYWQIWPNPCLVGATVGWCVGGLGSLVIPVKSIIS